MNLRKYNRHHKQHHDQSDCGVICLATVLSFHGSYFSIEQLRELSGTSSTGTTMLGLIQCARQIGFEADGYKAETVDLVNCNDISILHVIKENMLQHYVVCYGYSKENESFIISDPSKKRVEAISVNDLNQIWESKSLIRLRPNVIHNSGSKPPKKHKWILEYLKADSNIISMAILLGLVVSILSLSSAVFSQIYVDSFLPSKDFVKVCFGGGLLLLFLLVSGFLDYIKQVFLIRQGRDFSVRIIDYFYSKLVHLPKRFFDTRSIGDLTARMNDTNRIQNTVTSFIGNIIVHLLIFFSSTTAIFLYRWELGVLSLFWIPILVLIIRFYHPKLINAQRDVMESYSRNESNYINTLKGIDTIKSTNSQGIFIPYTLGLFKGYRSNVYNLGKIGVQYQFVLQITGALFLVGLIIYGTFLVFNNRLSGGAVIALIQLASILMASAIGIATLNIQLQEASVAMNRMFEYTTIDEEVSGFGDKETITDIETLTLNDISFGYPGRAPIISRFSLFVKKDMCVGVVGEVGSGKSTLLNLIQRSYKINSGKIIINKDLNVEDVNIGEWRSKIGVVHQEAHIFNGSILQNIALNFQEKALDEVIDFCSGFSIASLLEQLPQGYNTVIGEVGINLSGGQKQIVSLLRALYSKPRILLLDEVTASMDSNTRRKTVELIQQIKKQMLIISVSHDHHFLKDVSDSIYDLKSSTLIERNSSHGLLS